jgi:hypothetical protein
MTLRPLSGSPIMLQCMRPFLMWWTVPAPCNEVP